MIAAHLPVLQVVLPLLAAPLCILLHKPGLARGLTVSMNWLALAIAVVLLNQVLAHGVISYAIGGWAAPWGIEYRLDLLSAYVLVFITGVTAVVISAGRASVEKEIPEDRITLFYTAYSLFLSGLLGVVATGDVFNMFVFIEISSLASYALVSMGTSRRALVAAFQYLIMGTIGATFILIGVGLLYMLTGTLNMMDLAARLPETGSSRTLFAAFAFLMVGIGLKIAVFPLHFWLPNAYAYAPSIVSAFIAASATKVFVYVLLRFAFTVFGPQFADEMHMQELLLPLALVGVVTASAAAMFQKDVKRLLAWSSVAQVGYMVVGICFLSVQGLTAGIVHMFNHALMKSALFLSVACLVYRVGSSMLDDLHGVARRMPFTMAAFVGAGLSIIGVPASAGFISKWYLVSAALTAGWWPVAVVVLISSLLSVAYIWRVVVVAYFKPVPARAAWFAKNDDTGEPRMMLIATWFLVLANFYFGLHTALTVGIGGTAAEMLLGERR